MLTQVDQRLFAANGRARVIPGFSLPTRMTVVQLQGGSVWLHSPVAISDVLAAELNQLGPIGSIVAPSTTHATHLASAAAAFETARVFAPPGVAASRGVRVHVEFDGSKGCSWDEEIVGLPLLGLPKLKEQAFFHAPSKSLILTDLVFNLSAAQCRGVLSPLLKRAFDTHRGCACSRLYRSCIEDKAAFRSSVERLFEWPFERIIMSHGELIEDDAKQTLRHAMAPVLS